MQDKKLEYMKKDYEQIEIPRELRARVVSSMAKAKEESEAEESREAVQEKKKSSKIIKFVTRTAGTAVAAMLVITVLANSSASVAYAMSEIPVLGAIVRVVTFRNYENQDHNMEADIQIPEVSVEDQEGQVLEEATENLNQKIREYTDAIIAMYEQDVQAAKDAGIIEEGKLAVDVNYTVVTDNEKLFSLRFDQAVVMAGANQSARIYHVDKTTGQVIELDGLFRENTDYITPISESIKKQMKEQMEADSMVAYWLDSDVEEWNFKEIAADETFYVNEAGRLVIVFDEYEVAPGYMGVVEFEIPTEVVEDIVKEGYLE